MAWTSPSSVSKLLGTCHRPAPQSLSNASVLLLTLRRPLQMAPALLTGSPSISRSVHGMSGQPFKRLDIIECGVDKDLDILLLTETWLRRTGDDVSIAEMTPSGFSFLRMPRWPRLSGRGGGMALRRSHSAKGALQCSGHRRDNLPSTCRNSFLRTCRLVLSDQWQSPFLSFQIPKT